MKLLLAGSGALRDGSWAQGGLRISAVTWPLGPRLEDNEGFRVLGFRA